MDIRYMATTGHVTLVVTVTLDTCYARAAKLVHRYRLWTYCALAGAQLLDYLEAWLMLILTSSAPSLPHQSPSSVTRTRAPIWPLLQVSREAAQQDGGWTAPLPSPGRAPSSFCLRRCVNRKLVLLQLT